jgi:hypothetical protein
MRQGDKVRRKELEISLAVEKSDIESRIWNYNNSRMSSERENLRNSENDEPIIIFLSLSFFFLTLTCLLIFLLLSIWTIREEISQKKNAYYIPLTKDSVVSSYSKKICCCIIEFLSLNCCRSLLSFFFSSDILLDCLVDDELF